MLKNVNKTKLLLLAISKDNLIKKKSTFQLLWNLMDPVVSRCFFLFVCRTVMIKSCLLYDSSKSLPLSSLFLPFSPTSTSPILVLYVLSISIIFCALIWHHLISLHDVICCHHPSIHPKLPATLLTGCCDGWCVVGWVQFGCGRYFCFSWPLHLLASCWESSSKGICFFLFFNLHLFHDVTHNSCILTMLIYFSKKIKWWNNIYIYTWTYIQTDAL